MDINVGDIVEGRIIDFTHEGNGVLKIDNFAIFVSGGLIGDKVAVKIDELKRNFGIGSIENIIEPSEDRIVLDFPLNESRGGIPFIEYKYEKQLEWKRNKVQMDLAKIAKLTDIEVKETLGMKNPFGYRNHVQIPVGEKEGETLTGFYEINTNDIVDMDGSILQPEIGNKILKIIRSWIKEYDIKAYDKKTKKGILRHIGIRINRDNKAMVIIVIGASKLPREEELVQMLLKEKVVSIYYNINKMNSSIIYGSQYKKIYGEDQLLDHLGDYKFYLSPNSFFQINRIQAEVLYNKAMQYLDLKENDVVYDLYCGIGTIAIYMANKVKKVYGVEIVKAAIDDGKDNAIVNNIENIEFTLGKTEEALTKLMKKGKTANKIVLDPPRKGCEPIVLEAIVNISPEKIVYVSCNPTTLARDVKYLTDNGYKLVEVQPIDVFPHTSHTETVTLLVKE